MNVRSGFKARARWAATPAGSTIARIASSGIKVILLTSCEVRKPSKKCRKGTRARSVAAWQISAMSWASCTEREAIRAKPVARVAITSE